MSEEKCLVPGLPPEGRMKAEIGNLAWQNIIRESGAFPPQSFTVEIIHGGYVYRGTAYLVDDREAIPEVPIA